MSDLFPSPICGPAHQLAKLGARRRELLARERDELTALEAAQAEHDRLQHVIEDDEAKATALGTEPVVNKGASGKLTKLARGVEEHTAAADRFGRAVVQLDDEIRRVTMDNCNELVNEAIDQHDHARQRITDLVAELKQQQAALRSAYVACQSVLSTSGHAAQTARMAVPPSLEMLVREGGAPPLMDDRALTV
jgi:chromosome segregation ATPase